MAKVERRHVLEKTVRALTGTSVTLDRAEVFAEIFPAMSPLERGLYQEGVMERAQHAVGNVKGEPGSGVLNETHLAADSALRHLMESVYLNASGPRRRILGE
jgi:hypothetical protein